MNSVHEQCSFVCVHVCSRLQPGHRAVHELLLFMNCSFVFMFAEIIPRSRFELAMSGCARHGHRVYQLNAPNTVEMHINKLVLRLGDADGGLPAP